MLILAQYRWEGPDALTPGKHTIVFDYTYDGPGIAKGGSGVLDLLLERRGCRQRNFYGNESIRGSTTIMAVGGPRVSSYASGDDGLPSWNDGPAKRRRMPGP
jgi:hypothetical protein